MLCAIFIQTKSVAPADVRDVAIHGIAAVEGAHLLDESCELQLFIADQDRNNYFSLLVVLMNDRIMASCGYNT